MIIMVENVCSGMCGVEVVWCRRRLPYACRDGGVGVVAWCAVGVCLVR